MEQLSWCAHLLSLCFGAQELELLRPMALEPVPRSKRSQRSAESVHLK